MKIAVIGAGYVGLVSGTCFAELGMDVTCIDKDKAKVAKLRKGEIPIYEPGLEELVRKNAEAGRLRFSCDTASGIDGCAVVFCAVGTPSDGGGNADLKYVFEVAREVGRNIDSYTVFVTKSTVPVGMCGKIKEAMEEEMRLRGEEVEFDVVSNPEFLREGDAINDFMYPDRIIVGVESGRARNIMADLYAAFEDRGCPVIYADTASAEMIKYASNAMLATRISFMNDIANACELLGANVDMVREGIGADSRIGSKFLYPGIGYGGSCFPKDVKALIKSASDKGYDMHVLRSVERVNEQQKRVLFEKFSRHFGGDIRGRTVAVWGLSFKPETDDMREAPSLVLISLLLGEGCKVRVYDPVAMDEGRRRLGDSVDYLIDMYGAVEGADALMLVTEWRQFRDPDWKRMALSMKHAVVFDGRNIFDRREAAVNGFACYSIGLQ